SLFERVEGQQFKLCSTPSSSAPSIHAETGRQKTMNSTVRKVLVVGGNGFVGSAVCKAALARGVQVTSVSSSGNPYRTPKGHSPAWTAKVLLLIDYAALEVDWQRGDAFHPETFAHLLPEVDGVVHTLGTLIEDSSYKDAIRQGNIPALASSFFKAATGDTGNPLAKNDSTNRKTYNALNRDAALRVCEAFLASPPEANGSTNKPRPFIFVSAEDIFRPVIPARYIESKREAEQGIEQMIGNSTEYRGVYIRPSLVYHAHVRPLTTPAAALLDLSATLHKKVPQSLPTPSSILRSIGSSFGPRSTETSTSVFESVANALTIPPIHVDHVAAAICVALDSRNDVRGVVGVRRMRELIGWVEDGEAKSGTGLAVAPETPRPTSFLSMHYNLRHSLARAYAIRADARRAISQSAAAKRALPFVLNTHKGTQEDRDERVVRMLMFGKPGAGKGTLTARLTRKYPIISLSTGDLLRQHIAERTEIGLEAEEIVARGGLLPDETVLKVLTSKLDSLQHKHWILDGFPRTLGQAELLDTHLKKRNMPLTLVVNLDVPDEVILSRISDRWVHLPSGRVYNMSYNRPRVEGFDDQTGEPLTKRPDDNPEIFARRLAAFYTQTSPLLSYFDKTAAQPDAPRPNTHQHPHQLSFHAPSGLKVKTLSGTTSDEIWPQLDRLIQNTFPGLRERLEPKAVKTRQLVSSAITAGLDATSSR
ncbi:hypothetical protein CVT26_003691, partial [Gymnopilus dilepis]